MVCVSASVNLPLHHKVQKFSSGTGSPGWSRKMDRKTVVVTGCGTWPRNDHWWRQFSLSRVEKSSDYTVAHVGDISIKLKTEVLD